MTYGRSTSEQALWETSYTLFTHMTSILVYQHLASVRAMPQSYVITRIPYLDSWIQLIIFSYITTYT